MEKLPIKWIWENEQFGEFPFDYERISKTLTLIHSTHEKLHTLLLFFDKKELDAIETENYTKEIMDSSKIEGEYLKRESVRASVVSALSNSRTSSKETRHTQALAKLVLDSKKNNLDITKERIHSWHYALFSEDKSAREEGIIPGQYRDRDIAVRENGVLKYSAIPQNRVEEQMSKLVDYCNNSKSDPYVKSAIVHLWFVAIHPYADGNGRLSRVVADYVLSKDNKNTYKYFSLSSAIANKRDNYYMELDETTNLWKNRHFDFTNWINYHNKILDEGISETVKKIDHVIFKARFWDKYREESLNTRQIKVLSTLLGDKYSVKKNLGKKEYMGLTDCTSTTASRDIKDLLEKGCIVNEKGFEGRNTTYKINFITQI